MISDKWDERLRQYITGIVQQYGHKMLAINNVSDHIHVFIGLDPRQSISDLLRKVKGDSSEWINKQKFTSSKFQWQAGYGAFSHSRSQLDKVVQYIFNHQEHHRKATFIEEYTKMLDDFGITYDERYIFADPE